MIYFFRTNVRVSITILPLFIFVCCLANSSLPSEQTYFLNGPEKRAFVIILLWTKVARTRVADSKFYKSSNVPVYCDVSIWYGTSGLNYFPAFTSNIYTILSISIQIKRIFSTNYNLGQNNCTLFSRFSTISLQYKWIGTRLLSLESERTNYLASCRTA